MAELRKDWLFGRSVIIAENRALRPNEFATSTPNTAATATAAAKCYFCPGNEAGTPPAVYEQWDEQGHWRVRVIPNKYPAVTLEREEVGVNAQPAFGVHEVIVESARHIDRTSALTVQELGHVLDSYAARLRHWRNDDRLAYSLIFKNQGPQAGASIAHLHSQLIATSEIPPAVDAELQRAKAAFAQHDACPYCRMIADEREQASRIVFERDGYVIFCPFASVQPYEVWLMPVDHSPSFERLTSSGELDRLAGVLHAVIGRLESVVPSASHNLLLRTAPWRLGCDEWFHWRIELLPRTNSIAGLEFATGIFINAVAPEHAAPRLRPA